ncbi:hypothetical protein Q9K83_000143 [Escherichia coli]|uniref:DUF6418 domain-containing protein n=2 Tax=Escherichia coli TaxID=562 RepID=UPI0002C8D400|nr:DUF6418 domain-containing protein [Escherichia coli]EEQ2239655.1 hypothetical protein [Escherichia coli]EEQ9806434.1 hypothetical protein [Escherichia coli]EEX4245608.1 hypothetical protein [Escherichia coli]EFC5004131.1 hypothetical protein [Escherichia coli]EFD1363821.1 hypothetical protein [Escherichia coli]
MKISVFTFLRIILILLSGILVLITNAGYNVNFLGITILLLYGYIIYNYRPIEFVNNLLFFIILVPMLIGGALIENGTYLFEIDSYTYWNGTFIINLFYTLLFIEFLLVNVKAKRKNSIRIKPVFIEIIILLSVFVLYATFIKTGIPLLKGIHRTIYFGTIVPEYVNFIKGRLSFICLVLGYYYFISKSKRYLLYFCLIVIYHILCSIKGGELLIIIYAFFLPLTLNYSEAALSINKKKVNRKIRYTLIFLIISIFTIIFINYQTVENYDKGTSALDKIEKRIEAAGQIWWVINDQKQVDAQFRWDKFIDNFSDKNDQYAQGMNQLMNEVVPANILDTWRSADDRGRSLANGFPAIGYYYFGYIGVVGFLIAFGLIVILVKRDILSSFKSGDILSFLFLGPILELVIRVVAQGDINLFFEGRTYAILFAYTFYGFIKKAVSGDAFRG